MFWFCQCVFVWGGEALPVHRIGDGVVPGGAADRDGVLQLAVALADGVLGQALVQSGAACSRGGPGGQGAAVSVQRGRNGDLGGGVGSSDCDLSCCGSTRHRENWTTGKVIPGTRLYRVGTQGHAHGQQQGQCGDTLFHGSILLSLVVEPPFYGSL